jgi:hypothetical protein
MAIPVSSRRARLQAYQGKSCFISAGHTMGSAAWLAQVLSPATVEARSNDPFQTCSIGCFAKITGRAAPAGAIITFLITREAIGDVVCLMT